jgi:predicted nucleic-acid-binding Zn-ribbon protein
MGGWNIENIFNELFKFLDLKNREFISAKQRDKEAKIINFNKLLHNLNLFLHKIFTEKAYTEIYKKKESNIVSFSKKTVWTFKSNQTVSQII